MSPVKWVEPNDRTHPAFGDALRRASAAGVRIIAVDCSVTPDTLTVKNNIPVRLSSVVSEGELL
jgi:sugar fermentation stimulation protein A